MVYIQPKYSLEKDGCSGGEAHIRWQSDQMGFLMPDQFIAIFERNSFVVEIDFFILSAIF